MDGILPALKEHESTDVDEIIDGKRITNILKMSTSLLSADSGLTEKILPVLKGSESADGESTQRPCSQLVTRSTELA